MGPGAGEVVGGGERVGGEAFLVGPCQVDHDFLPLLRRLVDHSDGYRSFKTPVLGVTWPYFGQKRPSSHFFRDKLTFKKMFAVHRVAWFFKALTLFGEPLLLKGSNSF